MSHWFTKSQIWQRYKVGVLLSDFVDKAKTLLQAGCFVYFVREYCIEFSVVSSCGVWSSFCTFQWAQILIGKCSPLHAVHGAKHAAHL